MRKVLSFLSLSSLLVLIVVVASTHFFAFTPQHEITRLEKGWTVNYHNRQYVNTNLEHLSRQVGATFQRGDVITLNLSAPLTKLDAPFPYLILKTQYCAYEVFLDNELLDSKYMDNLRARTFIGTGYTTVCLGNDYVGKRLSIKLYVTENDTHANIISPMIGNYDDLYREVMHTAMYAFFVSIFLTVFGLVFLVLSMLFYIQSTDVSTQVLCSLLTTIIGIWMLSSFDLIDFIIPSSTSTFLEFCAVYMITPIFYLIIYNLHRRYNTKILRIMGIATFCFSIFFIILHVTDTVHLNHFEFIFYCLSLIGVAHLGYYIYVDIKAKNTSASLKILMLGITVLSICLLIYAGSGAFSALADYRQSLIMQLIIPSGGLFFVITQLLNYFIFMTRSFSRKKEYAALAKIAYIDNLTSLPNRASSDKKLLELDTTNTDYCLISMDLNGLKEVNDNSGHPAGDRLLKSFAHALNEAFKEKGTAHRIGGDEFLVTIDSITRDEVESLLETFSQTLKDLDKDDPDLNHSVSYGYAFRSETEDKKSHSVFILADQRMYDNKRNQYARPQ